VCDPAEHCVDPVAEQRCREELSWRRTIGCMCFRAFVEDECFRAFVEDKVHTGSVYLFTRID
jgi:hypothetical protein